MKRRAKPYFFIANELAKHLSGRGPLFFRPLLKHSTMTFWRLIDDLEDYSHWHGISCLNVSWRKSVAINCNY